MSNERKTYLIVLNILPLTRRSTLSRGTPSVSNVGCKYAFKAQIKGREKPSVTLILLSTHPDCELVFTKCSVTPLWAAFAHSDKSTTTGLLCWRVQQRQNCIDQVTHSETHAHTQTHMTRYIAKARGLWSKNWDIFQDDSLSCSPATLWYVTLTLDNLP